MNAPPSALADPVRVGLTGAGCIGITHAETLARRILGAHLVAIADPRPGAGKAVFCEKPMAETLEGADRAIAAAKSAGLPLQVGFNRRFARAFREAHEVIAAGGIGTPQLLRSLTRDPGLANPGAVPPWTIFIQTLIHDFDALNWLNPGAEAVEVYATADAFESYQARGPVPLKQPEA